jgi:flagellar biosynthetic protein FliR
MLPWVLCVGLLTVRLSVAVALSPALSSYGVPATVRIALTIALAALTFADRAPLVAAATWAVNPELLLVPVCAEVFIGAALGLGVHVVLAAMALAGRLMDVQIGFAMGSVFDPVTRSSSNVLASMTVLLGVTLFFVTDAHLQLAQMVSRSVDLLPLGEMPALKDPMRLLFSAGAMFSLGFALAAPVTLALLLTDLAMAVASRNMPQINVLILAMPVKVIVGYAVLAVALNGWAGAMSQELSHMANALGVA